MLTKNIKLKLFTKKKLKKNLKKKLITLINKPEATNNEKI